MNRNSIYNAISGTCLLVGIGGLGGACDTGKGFVLSIVLMSVGAAIEYLVNPTKKSLYLERKNRNRL